MRIKFRCLECGTISTMLVSEKLPTAEAAQLAVRLDELVKQHHQHVKRIRVVTENSLGVEKEFLIDPSRPTRLNKQNFHLGKR